MSLRPRGWNRSYSIQNARGSNNNAIKHQEFVRHPKLLPSNPKGTEVREYAPSKIVWAIISWTGPPFTPKTTPRAGESGIFPGIHPQPRQPSKTKVKKGPPGLTAGEPSHPVPENRCHLRRFPDRRLHLSKMGHLCQRGPKGQLPHSADFPIIGSEQTSIVLRL